MSAKMVATSSNTWLSGWMRPASAGGSRSGRVTSMVSDFSRASSAADFRTSRRPVRAPGTLSLARVMGAARRQGLGDVVLGEVDGRALRLALVGRHLAEGGEQRRDRALLAEGCDANG